MKCEKNKLQGIWVALVTPWDEARARPRQEVIASLVQRFVSARVNGLFVLGTTGEGFLFSSEERKFFAEVILKETNRQLPIIVHVGHETTRTAIELAEHAQKVGAWGVSLAPPSRYRLDLHELETHFVAVAKAVSEIPVLLYDIPSAGINEIGATLLERVHERAPNVVGVKVSRSDWVGWNGYLRLTEHMSILVGNDMLCLPLLFMGAAGVVSGPANIFPELYVELFERLKNGELRGARQCQKLIDELCQILTYGQPVACIKEALQWLGLDVGEARPPLRSLGLAERERLRQALEALKKKVESTIINRGGGE